MSASVPLWAWLVFVGPVLALLFLDLFVLHRKAREVSFKEALWLSGLWIAVSLTFGGFVWYLGGLEAAEEYLAAYPIEKSLLVIPAALRCLPSRREDRGVLAIATHFREKAT